MCLDYVGYQNSTKPQGGMGIYRNPIDSRRTANQECLQMCAELRDVLLLISYMKSYCERMWTKFETAARRIGHYRPG